VYKNRKKRHHLYWLESAARCGFWESLQKHSQARLTIVYNCVRKQRNTTPFSALKIPIKLSRVTIYFDFWLTYTTELLTTGTDFFEEIQDQFQVHWTAPEWWAEMDRFLGFEYLGGLL
jgi:hypothetical protein